MAVKKIAQYYRKFRASSLLLGLLMQVVIGLAMGLWVMNALMMGVEEDNYLILFIAPFALFELIATALTVVVATEPAKVITEAVAQATKEAGNTAPTDTNRPKFKKNGIQEIVGEIHALGLAQQSRPVVKITGQELLRQTVESLPVGVIMLDSKHQIVERNAHSPLRENAEDMDDINLLFDESQSFTKWLKHCEEHEIKAQHTWTRVGNKPSEEGERRYYDVLASYNKKGEGGIDVILVTVDRTKEYSPDEEAMDFIALAAHELRGPITVIHGYLDVLSDELHDELDDDYRALMERLTVSASRLSSYVNNILNASKFDRRHFKLHLGERKLQNIYHSVEQDLQMRARTQNRLLSVDIPADLPTVAADKNSVGEVITNLVDNGIKYSNEGGQVVVKARTLGNFVEMSVSDSGIGMPANVVQKLFTKFYRSHRSRETVAGTGLGLYISKAIIESHGGKMSVRSSEGHGSTFTFTLPIYATVADKLMASNNKNEAIIENSNGWIKNHAMYRG